MSAESTDRALESGFSPGSLDPTTSNAVDPRLDGDGKRQQNRRRAGAGFVRFDAGGDSQAYADLLLILT